MRNHSKLSLIILWNNFLTTLYKVLDDLTHVATWNEKPFSTSTDVVVPQINITISVQGRMTLHQLSIQ
jgi:hypothetical protein